jgi:hypothetical protein
MAYSPLLRLSSGEGTGSTEGESPLLELASGEAAGTTGRSLMAGGDMSVGPGAAGTAESILYAIKSSISGVAASRTKHSAPHPAVQLDLRSCCVTRLLARDVAETVHTCISSFWFESPCRGMRRAVARDAGAAQSSRRTSPPAEGLTGATVIVSSDKYVGVCLRGGTSSAEDERYAVGLEQKCMGPILWSGAYLLRQASLSKVRLRASPGRR